MEEQNQELREEGTQLTLISILFEVKRNILLLIIVTLALALAGGIYGRFFVATKYSSKASLIVIPPETENVETHTTNTSDFSYAVYIAGTVGEIIKSEVVCGKVAKAYNEGIEAYNADDSHSEKMNKISAGLVKSGLTVTTQEKNFVVNITFTSTDPHAKEILSQVLTTTLEYIDSDYSGMVWYSSRFTILDTAGAPSPDSSSRTIKYLLIFALVGVALSLGIIVLKMILTDTYNKKEDLENDIPVEVLALINDLTDSKEGHKVG